VPDGAARIKDDMKRINLLYNTTMGISNIGRYKILHELGQGAMGVVFRGYDTIIDRDVAIKTVKLGILQEKVKKSELIKLFYREVQIAGRLAHPNIATIYDAGDYNDIHYFVMEYVDGISLKQVIMDKMPLTLLQRVRILSMIAGALHYAHQQGVIHRDIKPANIMLMDSGQTKIMDFGIAMLSSAEDTASPTHQSKVVGTPSYMSPEQIAGEEVDQQSDIFSLGALAYEFLTGRKPFTAANMADLFKNIKTAEPIPPSTLDPRIPPSIDSCVMKALQKGKENRYPSASDFADDLEIFINKTEIAPGSGAEIANLEILTALKKNYAFFMDFSIEELHKVFTLSQKNQFGEGDVIFEEGSVGRKMYIIISGTVKITKVFSNNDEETILNILKKGECFGELAFITSAPRFATARSLTKCILIAMNEVILRTAEPKLCLKLYRNLALVLSEKLKKSDQKVNELLAGGRQIENPPPTDAA
jgi:serine/threonine-protein kinase